MPDDYRRRLLRIAETLIGADPDEGISTDELMGASGLSAEGVRSALYDLEQLGIASNDTALTAFVHAGVERNSRKRFDEAAELEIALIAQMREAAPDMGKGQTWPLHLRVAAQTLRDAGVTDPLPEKLKRIVGSIARDGRGEGGDAGSLGVRQRDYRDSAGDAAARVVGVGGTCVAPTRGGKAPAGALARLFAAPGAGARTCWLKPLSASYWKRSRPTCF